MRTSLLDGSKSAHPWSKHYDLMWQKRNISTHIPMETRADFFVCAIVHHLLGNRSLQLKCNLQIPIEYCFPFQNLFGVSNFHSHADWFATCSLLQLCAIIAIHVRVLLAILVWPNSKPINNFILPKKNVWHRACAVPFATQNCPSSKYCEELVCCGPFDFHWPFDLQMLSVQLKHARWSYVY